MHCRPFLKKFFTEFPKGTKHKVRSEACVWPSLSVSVDVGESVPGVVSVSEGVGEGVPGGKGVPGVVSVSVCVRKGVCQ